MVSATTYIYFKKKLNLKLTFKVNEIKKKDTC